MSEIGEEPYRIIEELRAERDAYSENADKMNAAASRYLRRAEQADKERDKLCVELAAERKRREEGFELARQWELGAMRYEAERDELRALLREALESWIPACVIRSSLEAISLENFMSRIDAALNKGDGDE